MTEKYFQILNEAFKWLLMQGHVTKYLFIHLKINIVKFYFMKKINR